MYNEMCRLMYNCVGYMYIEMCRLMYIGFPFVFSIFCLQGYVENILYQKDVGSLECCEIKDGKVPVVGRQLYRVHWLRDIHVTYSCLIPVISVQYFEYWNAEEFGWNVCQSISSFYGTWQLKFLWKDYRKFIHNAVEVFIYTGVKYVIFHVQHYAWGEKYAVLNIV